MYPPVRPVAAEAEVSVSPKLQALLIIGEHRPCVPIPNRGSAVSAKGFHPGRRMGLGPLPD